MSGVMAAAYATTALKEEDGPGSDLATNAGRVYQEIYYKEYKQFREMARLFYSSNLTADSYFWEARRIAPVDEYSPRQSFIQAVAGQPPRGYERAVLDRGEAPEDFVSSVRAVESERRSRSQRVAGLRGDPQRNQILLAVPRLSEGARDCPPASAGRRGIRLGSYPKHRIPTGTALPVANWWPAWYR